MAEYAKDYMQEYNYIIWYESGYVSSRTIPSAEIIDCTIIHFDCEAIEISAREDD